MLLKFLPGRSYTVHDRVWIRCINDDRPALRDVKWNLVTFSNYLDRRQLECMPHAKFVERVWVAKGKVRYAQL